MLRCEASYLAVNVDQVHQLFRLVAVPCHFALLIAKGQLEDSETDKPKQKRCISFVFISVIDTWDISNISHLCFLAEKAHLQTCDSSKHGFLSVRGRFLSNSQRPEQHPYILLMETHRIYSINTYKALMQHTTSFSSACI